MTTSADSVPAAPLPTREELVAMVARAHAGASYAESRDAGKALAAQSKLPAIVAENLGAGFGQWEWFPEIDAIVDFALAYVPPSDETELTAIARTWASDDAAGRHTLMALVGREIVHHELRRIDVPALKQLVSERNAARARELRVALGFDAGKADAPAAAPKEKKAAAPAAAAAPKRAPADPNAPPGPMRMPKPAFVPPKKREPEPPPRRFTHPKFGEGVLVKTEGTGDDTKLTIAFSSGSKTLLARFVTELPS